MKLLRYGMSATGASGAAKNFEIALKGAPVIQSELRTIRDLWQNAIGREMQR